MPMAVWQYYIRLPTLGHVLDEQYIFLFQVQCSRIERVNECFTGKHSVTVNCHLCIFNSKDLFFYSNVKIMKKKYKKRR